MARRKPKNVSEARITEVENLLLAHDGAERVNFDAADLAELRAEALECISLDYRASEREEYRNGMLPEGKKYFRLSEASKGYTATYEAATVGDEPGWSYSVTCDGRLVFEGWSRGRKQHAEAEVREGINAREALLEAARKAS